MDPISKVVDKAEELLGHSPHPAIVSVPLGAFVVSNVCDGVALLTGTDDYDKAASISMAVGLVGAAGAVVTGLRDYGYIPPDRHPNKDVATTHGLGNAVVGSLFVASYVLRTRDQAEGRRTSAAARLLALAGGALSMYTAWLGGKLVQEYGEAVKPVMERQQHEEGRGRLEQDTEGAGRVGPQVFSGRSQANQVGRNG